MTKKIRLNRNFIVLTMLLGILSVSFPIQEFFHAHHAFEDECNAQHSCEHTAHISKQDFHLGCVFLLANNSFLQADFNWQLPSLDISTQIFYFVDREYVTSFYYTSTRAPPSVVLS